MAKFMYINDTKNEYEVTLINSTIDCQREINKRTVFTLNEQTDRGEVSIFKFTVPQPLREDGQFKL